MKKDIVMALIGGLWGFISYYISKALTSDHIIGVVLLFALIIVGGFCIVCVSKNIETM